MKADLKSNGLLIGYARVSTQDQNLELQVEALQNAGCKKIFEDRASGSWAERLGLAQARENLRAGDTLVVWKLDRREEASSIWSTSSGIYKSRECSSRA